MHEQDEDAARNPLEKRVPGHLFQFEERIFGMTLHQLLCDIGAGIGIVSAFPGWAHRGERAAGGVRAGADPWESGRTDAALLALSVRAFALCAKAHHLA